MKKATFAVSKVDLRFIQKASNFFSTVSIVSYSPVYKFFFYIQELIIILVKIFFEKSVASAEELFWECWAWREAALSAPCLDWHCRNRWGPGDGITKLYIRVAGEKEC